MLLMLLLNNNRIGAEYEASDLISDFLLQKIISSYPLAFYLNLQRYFSIPQAFLTFLQVRIWR